MIVTQLTQKTKYRFWHTGCSYRYEITKYEFLPADDLLGIYPDSVTVSFKGVSKPPDVRWGAAMDNDSWENDLRQQINIPRGMRGTWATDVDKFFKPTYCPPISEGYPEWADGNGFEECIGRANDFMLFLKKMQEKVAAAKASRPSRGRTNEEDDGASTYGGPEEYDM
jgi:hypothetical protein